MKKKSGKEIRDVETILTFKINEKKFCFKVADVREILVIDEITPLPNTPDYIKGVIHLRGDIIPVIDAGAKFYDINHKITERSCLIILQQKSQSAVGFIVDEIEEVVTIDKSEIKEIESVYFEIDENYIDGIVEVRNNLRVMLNSKTLLNNSENFLTEKLEEGEVK